MIMTLTSCRGKEPRSFSVMRDAEKNFEPLAGQGHKSTGVRAMCSRYI